MSLFLCSKGGTQPACVCVLDKRKGCGWKVFCTLTDRTDTEATRRPEKDQHLQQLTNQATVNAL